MEQDAAGSAEEAVAALGCPRCSCPLSAVTDSRVLTVRGVKVVRSRRVCDHCQHVFYIKQPAEPTTAKVAERDRLGVKCPVCQSTNLSVIHTRRQEGKMVRERECLDCGRERIYTKETVMGMP